MDDTVGERIKKTRKDKGWSQKDLAAKLGISHALVSQYERGERNPKIDTLHKIADALGVPLNDLVNGAWLSAENGVDIIADAMVERVKRTLKREEANLIIQYRDLNRNAKDLIYSIIELVTRTPGMAKERETSDDEQPPAVRIPEE